MKVSKFNKILFALLVLLLIVSYFVSKNVPVEGDGTQYILMSQSLIDHQWPNLNIIDVKTVDKEFSAFDRFNSLPCSNQLITCIKNHSDCCGYFKNDQGYYYSYHFFFYSLINVPSLWFSTIAKISPTRSFVITNSIIIAITLFYILLFGYSSEIRRFTILAFYLLCGTTFYINWPSPEVFTCSMLILGFLFFENKRYYISAFLFAMAAQQNPPIGILFGIPIIYALYFDVYKKRHNVSSSIKAITVLLFLIVFVFSSPLYYFVLYGTPNLIIKSGGTNNQLISIIRLISFYADFDQGMIRGMPFLIFALMMALIYYTIFASKNNKLFWKTSEYIIASMIIAIPSLSTTNWNAGSQVFMRYAYWGSVPIAFAFATLVERLPLKVGKIVSAIMVIGQLIWVIQYKIYGTNAYYLFHSNISQYVLDNYPMYYNPIPEIFIERGQHYEGVDKKVVYYYVHDKILTKILIQHGYSNINIPLCGWRENLQRNSFNVKVVKEEQNWVYWNTNMPCNIPNGFYSLDPKYIISSFPYNISFKAADSNSNIFIIRGFSAKEPWGTWSIGKESVINFGLNNSDVAPLYIHLLFNAFVTKKHIQTFGFYLNGHLLGKNTFKNYYNNQVIFNISGLTQKQNILLIKTPDAVTPKSLGINNDTRELGIGLISIQITDKK